MISLTATMFLAFAVTLTEANSVEYYKTIPQDEFSTYHGSKLPELEYYDDYEALRSDSNTVVIYPIFTQSAYDWGGIHYFLKGTCETCITSKIPDYYEKSYTSSANAFRILEFLR